MDDTKTRIISDIHVDKTNGCSATSNPAFNLLEVPQRLQNFLKTHFKGSMKNEAKTDIANLVLSKEKESCSALEVSLEKQLDAWKKNPTWVDEVPEIKTKGLLDIAKRMSTKGILTLGKKTLSVNVPKGSLCNLNVKFKVGLPPDAIYNIVIDPDNRRVFKNIKEVISRRVLVDEGLRQIVEVEQAAIWRFLWWSGTISVHVLVDQNRRDHSVRFKQGKTGFMKRFEGCWKVEPLFVDEQLCFPYKPETWADYDLCTAGKGRIGSIVRLEQLVQPAILPPPPFSWYLRGITARTSEMLIHDLLAETARIRGAANHDSSNRELTLSSDPNVGSPVRSATDIKERWRQRRSKHRRRRSLVMLGNAGLPA